MDLFTQLKTFAEPSMEAFQSDLEHDRAWLEAHPGEPFVHVTRATGTHLFPIPPPSSLLDDSPIPYLFATARPSEVFRQLREVMSGQLSSSARVWLLSDGTRIRKTNQAACVEAYDTGLRIAKRRARNA